MNAPVLIDDPRVLAVRIEECGETLVDVRERPTLTTDLSPGYGKVRSDVERRLYCREGAARRIGEAEKVLPDGVRLLVYECYRPPELQAALWEEALKTLRQRHPGWTEEDLTRENAKFIAPPRAVPPHSTGGAVDVTLADNSGEELDLGSPLNRNSPLDRTFAKGIAEEGTRNRELLLSAMESAGFANYGYEWWHYSYGDRYWAFQRGENAAIYGAV